MRFLESVWITSSRFRFGAFVVPFHPVDENPVLRIERHLELAEWMDQLGFDEFSMGERHSGGFGCFLNIQAQWTDWIEMRKSYELISRFVMPKGNGLNVNYQSSQAWRGQIMNCSRGSCSGHRMRGL